MFELRLNPALDPTLYAHQYAERRWFQVHNFFDDDSAAFLERAVQTLPYRLLFQDDTQKNLMMTPAELNALSAAEKQNLQRGISERAAKGIGHTYLVYPMVVALMEGWDEDHPIHALTAFLNSPEFIKFAAISSNRPDVTKIDAHASCFHPGHYLNKHVDDGLIDERQVAYTLGFSRDWIADWGGMLLVYDDKEDVRTGLKPRFNTLTVFDGRIPHSVTPLSPFAPKPRFTVTGWFRNDPIPKKT